MKLNDVPLGFLPAFEAAGRLGSFAAAAAELQVTPSAISQQIRTLEDVLDVELFERTGRSVVLTPVGQGYLEEVRQSLSALALSTERLRRKSRGGVLRLSTLSVAAHEFLLPRLPAFRARFPSIELRIETSNELVDFRVSECDAAIRVGSTWPGLDVRSLGEITLAPVCSPELAKSIREPADLARYTLLDPGGIGPRVFAAFADAARCSQPTAAGEVWSFETCHEALCAAEHGLGVTFAAFPVATHWVCSGRLAVPLPVRVQLPGALCWAHRAGEDGRFPFAAIGEWLASEYAALPPLAAGRIVPD